jgi:predicted  nucleic acid-binding Zn-ribbon protein
MGLAALAATRDCPKNQAMSVLAMTPLLDEINALIDAPSVDRSHLERTLTDGYAHALALETERSKLEKRVNEVMQRGNSTEKAQELTQLAKRLDGNAGELSHLREMLARLRRRAI